METWIIAVMVGAPIATGVGGYFLRKFIVQRQKKTFEARAQKIIDDAHKESEEIILDAKNEALKFLYSFDLGLNFSLARNNGP